MNYLSHYYFDQQSNNPELILGGLLPDLSHSFHKKAALKPGRHIIDLLQNPGTASLLRGWERHKAIDKYFHNSSFFIQETAYLKSQIKPLFLNPGPYTFFMAHILLELCLDGMLLKTRKVDPVVLYQQLSKVERATLEKFFIFSESDNPTGFPLFLANFISQGYLSRYIEPEGIIYSLDRICERLWKTKFSKIEKTGLKKMIIKYMHRIEPGYLAIYDEIEKSGLP